MLIRVERPLEFDSDGQLVASVLSKKSAAGSTHVVIDIPIGPTAKVRSAAAADSLESRLLTTASAFNLTLRVLRTDGRQPVGFGIGPVLEARDVLGVLRRGPEAPADLRERALDLAAALLELAPGALAGSGREHAQRLLDSGAALKKFLDICTAQGGFSEPGLAAWCEPVLSVVSGTIAGIDNRRLAKIAKLAGAPGSPGSGIDCRVRIGHWVQKGEPLFQVYSHTRGQLAYALEYAAEHENIFSVAEE